MDTQSLNYHVAVSVFAFTLLVILFYILKKRNFLQETDTSLFVKLLTQVILPITIFGQLIDNHITAKHFELALVMFGSGIASLLLAYAIGKIIKLPNPTIGALMISSAFGSSTLFGYPLIKMAFPNDPSAFTDAVIISELGVGLPIFIIAPFIAMYFGNKSGKYSSLKSISIDYFKSPIFIAVAAGLGLSFLHLPLDSPFLSPVFSAFETVNMGLAIFACIILSLQLKPVSVRTIIPLLIISACIQLVAEPFFCRMQSNIFVFQPEALNVLIILSAMPSAVIGVVFTSKYDCDSKTASALTMSNIILSAAVVPLIFMLFRG